MAVGDTSPGLTGLGAWSRVAQDTVAPQGTAKASRQRGLEANTLGT